MINIVNLVNFRYISTHAALAANIMQVFIHAWGICYTRYSLKTKDEILFYIKKRELVAEQTPAEL